MRHKPPSLGRQLAIPATAMICLCALLASCRRHKQAPPASPPPVIAGELGGNQLATSPGPMFRAEANAPVHWQIPDQQTLRRAAEARRPIFAFVGTPQIPLCHTVLETIYHNNALVDSLNRNFIPVLVDADVCREIGLIAAPLCRELKKPISLPLLLWVSSDGNPITWLPLNNPNPKDIIETTTNAVNAVALTWTQWPDYVMKNGRLDNKNRRERL